MRNTIVKRSVGLSGPVFVLWLLYTLLYVVRELTFAFVVFAIGFASLFLTAISFLYFFYVACQFSGRLQMRVLRWLRTSRDWATDLFDVTQTPIVVPVGVPSPIATRINRRVGRDAHLDRNAL